MTRVYMQKINGDVEERKFKESKYVNFERSHRAHFHTPKHPYNNTFVFAMEFQKPIANSTEWLWTMCNMIRWLRAYVLLFFFIAVAVARAEFFSLFFFYIYFIFQFNVCSWLSQFVSNVVSLVEQNKIYATIALRTQHSTLDTLHTTPTPIDLLEIINNQQNYKI